MARELGWLVQIPGSTSFRAALEAQLAAELVARVGIEPQRDGFVVLFLGNGPRPVTDARGVTTLDGDLVGPDAFGVPITIAWSDARGGGRPIAHEVELETPEALRAWFLELPEAELRERYRPRAEPPFPMEEQLPFPVRWLPFAWPDVFIELETDRDLSPAEVDGFTAELERWREGWNGSGRGLVHNWSGLTRRAERRFEAHIDFGSAGTRALGAWLAAAAAVKGFRIERVTASGRPAE